MSTDAFFDGPQFFSTSMRRQSNLWTSDASCYALLRSGATSSRSLYSQLVIRLGYLASFELSLTPFVEVVEVTSLWWIWQIAGFTAEFPCSSTMCVSSHGSFGRSLKVYSKVTTGPRNNLSSAKPSQRAESIHNSQHQLSDSMKRPISNACLPLTVSGILLVTGTSLSLAQGELSPRAVWKPWQRDISQFEAELRKLVSEARIPEEASLKKRLDENSGGLEVVTDGYGGVVDFDAAEGTVQDVANERFGGMNIEWEFELAKDTEIYWNKSTKLIPKIARAAKGGKQDSKQPLFAIRIAKTDAGPFHSGDRVRLKASIDDLSRFRKDYTRATGLVAIYYLEDAPNPVFSLRLDEAEIALINGADQEAGKREPAKPEETPVTGAGENGRDELDQLLEEARKERLAYSPDKKLLAHLDGRQVTIWSVEERRLLHQFVLDGRPLAVAFSPDGGSLVTADGEGES
jgi:hypothetical protein